MLLLCAVAFWWGGYVAPQLLSLAFPSLLPPDNLLVQLDPEIEHGFANAASAATLLSVALLSAANAIVGGRRRTGRVAVGGWTMLATTAALVAVDEIADIHNYALIAVRRLVFGAELASAGWAAIAMLSPILAALALAMWIFVSRGLRSAAVRRPLVLGIGAWLLAAAFDATQSTLHKGQSHVLGSVVEEMLEISGALLILLGAVISLRGTAASRPPLRVLGGHWRKPLIGSAAVVAVCGSLAIAYAFRVLLIDAQGIYPNAFELRLGAHEAVIQEVRMPAYPIGRLDFRLAHRVGGDGDSGIASVRVTRLESPDQPLAEYQLEVPAAQVARWTSIDLIPPLVEPHGQRLALQLVADVEPDAELRVGVTQINRYVDGGFWINGARAYPNQDLEFAVYGAPEPTRSKLEAVWRTFRSDGRWPVLLANLGIGLTLITFIPVTLVAAALQRPCSAGVDDASSAASAAPPLA